MSKLLKDLRGQHRARVFLLTYLQSSLGTGAAAVALFVLAYDREPSPWSITLVLLAYDLPPGLLGPFVGALVDRVSRRWCVIAADLIRVGAFAGIAVVDSVEATAAFAFVAGAGPPPPPPPPRGRPPPPPPAGGPPAGAPPCGSPPGPRGPPGPPPAAGASPPPPGG